jgi:hypothetical protein
MKTGANTWTHVTGYVKITDLSSQKSASIFLSEEDLISLSHHSQKAFSMFWACLVPVRSNTCQNFLQDFFLPTTTYYPDKIQNRALKAIAFIAALALDIATLTCRILTVLPRLLYNGCKGVHPLQKRLIELGMDPDVFQSGHIAITNLCVKGSGLEKNWCGEVQIASEISYCQKNINLIESRWHDCDSHKSFSSGLSITTLKSGKNCEDALVRFSITDREAIEKLFPQFCCDKKEVLPLEIEKVIA